MMMRMMRKKRPLKNPKPLNKTTLKLSQTQIQLSMRPMLEDSLMMLEKTRFVSSSVSVELSAQSTF